jgi:hypothetical protein
MRRFTLSAVVLAVLVLALLLAAPSTARRGGPLRIDFPASDFDDLSISFYCLPVPVRPGGLEDAAAILLGGGPEAGHKFVVADGVATVDGERQYCASLTTFGTKVGAGRTARVSTARMWQRPAAGERGVRIAFPECPFGPPAGSCTVRNPFVYRVRSAGRSVAACRTLSSDASRLDAFVGTGGAWGDQWRVLKVRGKLTVIRPLEFVPAVIDRICSRNTPRAQRLGRELGLGGPSTPPQPVNGSLVVDSMANIFGAGLSTPPAPAGNGAGVLPPVFRFDPRPGLKATFNVTGSITCCITAGGPYNGPAGRSDADTDLLAAGVVSGVRAGSAMFLAGVFLSGRLPESPPPVDTATASPRLGQVFLVGNGRTVNVPTEATRLYLGIADGNGFEGRPGYYSDNSGTFAATFTIRP